MSLRGLAVGPAYVQHSGEGTLGNEAGSRGVLRLPGLEGAMAVSPGPLFVRCEPGGSEKVILRSLGPATLQPFHRFAKL